MNSFVIRLSGLLLGVLVLCMLTVAKMQVGLQDTGSKRKGRTPQRNGDTPVAADDVSLLKSDHRSCACCPLVHHWGVTSPDSQLCPDYDALFIQAS